MKNKEKKINAPEEVKEEKKTEEEGVQLTDEQLKNVNGGLKLDPERLRRKVEEVYPTE